MHHAKRLALAAVIGMMASGAHAGPPLLCFPYQCDETVQIAEPRKDAKPDDAVDRTLSSLASATTTLGRLETIRRGALAIGADSVQSRRVHERLMARALDAISRDKDAANAMFVAGMWVATTTQAGATLEGRPGEAHGIPGLLWVESAVAMNPSDPAKAFGAAVVLADRDQARAKPYLSTAVAAAEPGSALARSIESNLVFGGKKIGVMKKELADAPRAGK